MRSFTSTLQTQPRSHSTQSIYKNSAELSIVWQKSDSAFHSAVDFMGASFFSFSRCAIQCLVNASISVVASLISCPVGGRDKSSKIERLNLFFPIIPKLID